MNEKIVTKTPDNTLRSMFGDFYNRTMLPIVILVWAYFLIFLVPTIYSAVNFFKTDHTQLQIMYATIFICGIVLLSIMKIFAWQMVHRNSINRQIKALEDRIAELANASKKQ